MSNDSNNGSNRAFHNLRAQMATSEALECFDMLLPYFPSIPPDSAVAVNLQDGYKEGGTGIVNYNMLRPEALSVIDTLQEIGCGCLFIVPVPVSSLFEEQYLGTGAGSYGTAHRILQQNRAAFGAMQQGVSYIKFPPWFSIHMVGAGYKASCRAQLRELLIQNLLVRKPSVATAGATEQEVSALLSKYTLAR